MSQCVITLVSQPPFRYLCHPSRTHTQTPIKHDADTERSLNSIGITTETAGGTCRSFKELIDLIRKGPVSAKHRWQILCDSMSNEEVWEESVVYTDHYDDKMIPWCSPNEVQSSTFVRVTSFKIQTLEKPPGATSPLQLFAHMGSARLSLSQVVMDPILRYLLVDYFGLTVQFLEDLTDGETQPSCWLDEKFCEEDFDMNTVAGARA
nr:hypothetical protein B0A51_00067 [Rachicladosporium sp. CCFEE 5018]